jgi:hypothetical protein
MSMQPCSHCRVNMVSVGGSGLCDDCTAATAAKHKPPRLTPEQRDAIKEELYKHLVDNAGAGADPDDCLELIEKRLGVIPKAEPWSYQPTGDVEWLPPVKSAADLPPAAGRKDCICLHEDEECTHCFISDGERWHRVQILEHRR